MREISGTTRVAGVLGHPVGGSLSPAMHNAAFAELGLDWVYVPLDAPTDADARAVVAALRALATPGFNVTMPHKRLAATLCDEVDRLAKASGAVNTVTTTSRGLVGSNTDGPGLTDAVREELGFEVQGADIAIIGAGGAAAGAAAAFALAGARSVSVLARRQEQAEDVLRALESLATNTALLAATLDASVSDGGEHAERAIASAGLVVNATPVGMNASDASPVPLEWLTNDVVVFDMVYQRGDATELVRGARMRGVNAVSGLAMLVAQAALALDAWVGVPHAAPRQVMRAAAEAQLALRSSEASS